MRDGAFWKIGADDLLTLGQELEMLSRSVYAVKVHVAGEVDTQTMATPRGCPSTAALLRQVLLISPTEAHSRVKAARTVLPLSRPRRPVAPLCLLHGSTSPLWDGWDRSHHFRPCLGS
ncbi:DUF222 domain-containing protein [Nakamurella sp. PAMC28650]|nr:DUF222 domain-containing protein [Nakamurella sp. PAMC28650]